MKYCKNCGSENSDENQFCLNCRCDEFSETPVQRISPAPPAPPPMPMPMPIPMPMPMPRPAPKKPLTIYDVFALLGFVASLVGMFGVSVILHPLAAISSIVGFVGNARFKGIAIAGFVISIVGGIVSVVVAMYQNGLIPHWVIEGAFH